MNNIAVALMLAFLLLISCEQKTQKQSLVQHKIVAIVGSDTLYEAELSKITKSTSPQDSIALRKRFVNTWIRKALVLQIAKANLSNKVQDIENMVKEYRASLLINQYKQKYLAEHLDTLVTENDITEYASKNAHKFVAKHTLYHYYLAKVRTKNKKDIQFIKKLFAKEDVNLMQDFELENTTVISNGDTEWYTKKEILNHIPISEKELQTLQTGKVFITKDSISTYFFKPLVIIKAGQMSPQEIINEKVKKIILHNRKIALAQKLEYEIYEDAKNKNQFEVY